MVLALLLPTQVKPITYIYTTIRLNLIEPINLFHVIIYCLQAPENLALVKSP
jgi:hypothetical protein